jgi:adenine-specific DNA-methyltransferase
MLLSRYLGNKSSLLQPILDLTAERCEPNDRVMDIFAGSLSVSMAYKAAGYRVTANDINRLSAAFGNAYLVNSTIPAVSMEDLFRRRRTQILRKEANSRIRLLDGTKGFRFLEDDTLRDRFRDLCALFVHLQLVEDDELPAGWGRSDFFDAYCPEGRRSSFTSSRGSTGNRRFFTAENARRIDLILSQLRYWRLTEALPESVHWICLSVLCHAVEKVANTQGTYHDFPRDRWDSRAFKPLLLQPPPLDEVLGGCGNHVVGTEDSLSFVDGAGHHRLMYVDPPYNFRQYTAYYFLPNLIVAYPDLRDPESYFEDLTFVRGQNPDDDFASPFCSARRFLPAMRELMGRASVDSVLISYFTGRNHWSDFDSERDDTGLHLLSEMLSEPPFKAGSLVVREVPRKNYASYGGYQARDVHELLLLADVQC